MLFFKRKKGGYERADSQMTNFRRAVDVCGLHDVSFTGMSILMIMGESLMIIFSID